jgi:hypothetical protein
MLLVEVAINYSVAMVGRWEESLLDTTKDRIIVDEHLEGRST